MKIMIAYILILKFINISRTSVVMTKSNEKDDFSLFQCPFSNLKEIKILIKNLKWENVVSIRTFSNLCT